MESPVVLDKPPEYHGNDRGFPFEEEEGSGAWSSLAARHPDIAARLRQRPATATWARKRRPSSQDNTDDFGENFSGFDRFPFDDIPPEFREHFPSHWNRRFSEREEPPAAAPQPPPQASPPQHHTAATQTEQPAQTEHLQPPLTQHGLRNTVDLGQKSPADPSLVDADERAHRSMSAPPDQRPLNTPASHAPPPAPRVPPATDMPHPHRAQSPHAEPAKVRHIPIFVEGRDEPVINKAAAPAAPPPPDHRPHEPAQPHLDREQYFEDDHPSFHHPPNFSRAFGTPFNKGFRQGAQPFAQQKVFPQAAFNRGASPQRAPSPSPTPPRPHDEHFVKVPVHKEHAEPPRPQHQPPAPAPAAAPPREPTPPQQAPPKTANDPISQILRIQTDVLDLMNEVENFKGTKKDKRYLFLDEMLTRNLIKLDDIETEGKENIRQARKEAVRCIEKCIAVLESKAERGSSAATAQTNDVEMKDAENGEVASKEDKPDAKVEAQETQELPQTDAPQLQDQPNTETMAASPAPVADTPTEENKPSEQNENKVIENKPSPKKKVVKKRDKSKDNAAESTPEAAKDSNKVESHGDKVEVMQVDNKGETEQVMEVDGAASQ